MPRLIKRNCIVCDKEYEVFCPTCAEAAHQPSWKQIYCCENHRNICNICSAYTAKFKTAQEARDELRKYDLTDLDTYSKSMKKVIKDIYDNSTEIIKEETVEKELKVEEPKQTKQTFNRNKKNKKNR